MKLSSFEPHQERLTAFNREIDSLKQAREEWLDARVAECCALKVGDMVYNLKTMELAGVVTEVVRERDYDSLEDTRFELEIVVTSGAGTPQNPFRTLRIAEAEFDQGLYGKRSEAAALLRKKLQDVQSPSNP